jgi:molybdate transport system substrate-binding protein
MSRTIGLLAAFIAAQVTLAGAAEIKVFSTIGVKSVLEELIPKFEMSSGHKLDVTWSTAAPLAKRVESGEQADAVILIKNNSYSNPASGGASGVYIAKQIERMGITGQLKDKTKFPPPDGFSGTLLVSGDADIAIQSKPELLSVPGVTIVGPLPGDMAFTVVYAGGVQVGATQADAAKAFVNYLKSPEAQAVFMAKGYDPA